MSDPKSVFFLRVLETTVRQKVYTIEADDYEQASQMALKDKVIPVIDSQLSKDVKINNWFELPANLEGVEIHVKGGKNATPR